VVLGHRLWGGGMKDSRGPVRSPSRMVHLRFAGKPCLTAAAADSNSETLHDIINF
jgi:hypothetical protein